MIIYTEIPAGFSFDECLWFLDRGLDDVMHHVKDEKIIKALDIKGQPSILEISRQNSDLKINSSSSTLSEKEILDYIERWFDLSRNIEPFYQLLQGDSELKELAKKYKGLHLIGIPDLFETLCWCIVGQQINLTFAYRIKRKMVEQFGKRISQKPWPIYLFPEPKIIAELPVEVLMALQMTRKKAEYIIGIASAFENGTIQEERLRNNPEEQAKEWLLQLRGVGPWTANYTVMKALGGMNCWPAGDSGLNRALYRLKNIQPKKNSKEAEALFQKFSGWQSYLCYYLWRTQREKF